MNGNEDEQDLLMAYDAMQEEVRTATVRACIDLTPEPTIQACLSSESDEWATPQWLFDALHKEFGFTLDPCSDGKNAKCKRHYTMFDSGLLKDWGTETVYMNPPYSSVKAWIRKAYGSAQEGATVVALVPVRTDTDWWHSYAMKSEIRFIRGRLKFGDSTNYAPFPSAIIVFRPREFRLRTA